MERIKRKHGVVLLDRGDLPLISEYSISTRLGKPNNFGEVVKVDAQHLKTRRRMPLARLLTNCPPGMFVDHINHDTLDNRQENLRVVTRALNNANRRAVNENGYKGVIFDSRRINPTYRARLKRNGVRHNGLYRHSPEQAALDYNRMAIALWGRQIYVNDVRCVSMNPQPSEANCLFCNAPCGCCCVCFDTPSEGIRRLFDTLPG